MTAIQVYDSFAVVSFADDSVVLVVRPIEEGNYALYNSQATDVRDIRRGTLHLSKRNQKALGFNMVTDRTQKYNYLLNLITEDANGTRYVAQEGIEVDASIPLALFSPILTPTAIDNTSPLPVVDSNSIITVLGYSTDSEGKGRIDILDS